MQKKICYGCFREIADEAGKCPYCGYQGKQNISQYPIALPEGTILNGCYIIGRVLGQGGFGITYVAQDYKRKKLVAIKEYYPDTMVVRTDGHSVAAYSSQHAEGFTYGKACFLEEAKTLAEFIGNPNIVRVYCYFEENGTAYFAMDYVDGVSFQKYLAEHGGRISWHQTKNMLIPIMDALAAVHVKGIIHRDVSPDNIYVAKDGTVKLLDFGAARYSLGDRSRSLDVVLKHGYAPKEQYARHGRQGPYTDVYSMAATMYYAITFRVPPDSIDRSEEDELIMPSSLGVAIPPEEEDVLLKALAVRASDRYQNMTEFKQALLGADAQDHASDRSHTDQRGSTEQSSQNKYVQFDQEQNDQNRQEWSGQNSQQENVQKQSQQAENDGQDRQTNDAQNEPENNPSGRKKWMLPAAAAVTAAIILVAALSGKKTPDSDTANASLPNGSINSFETESSVSQVASSGLEMASVSSDIVSDTGSDTVTDTGDKTKLESFVISPVKGNEQKKTVSLRTKSVFYNKDGSLDYYSETEYNDYGESVKWSVVHGDDVTKDYYYVYDYDEKGNKILSIQYDFQGNEKSWEKTDWQYDADGNELGYVSYSRSGEELYRREFTYDDNGNEVKDICYKSGEFRFCYTYEYDANGNKTKTTEFDSAGNIEEWNETEYDNQGNAIKELYYEGEEVLDYWNSNEYDENGNKILEKVFSPEGELKYSYEQSYDVHGNQISWINREGDGTVSASSIDEYDYDENGNMLKEYHYFDGNLSSVTDFKVTEIFVREGKEE